MRVILAALAATFFIAASPAFAATGISCSQLPDAQRFVDGLRPGPNTSAAQHHLDAAKAAKSDRGCVSELGKANYYAKRSADADKRVASGTPRRVRHVQCADAMHQNRPGGTDYHGPYVAACRHS